MQSDLPQGDPRLQRINPGPEVATGYVDPCIVYLETTIPREIPVLAALFAPSSREVRGTDGQMSLFLDEVVMVHWIPTKNFWLPIPSFALRCSIIFQGKRLIIDEGKFVNMPGYSTEGFAKLIDKKTAFAGAVKALSQEEARSFIGLLPLPDDAWTHIVFAKKALGYSNLDSPSVTDALRFMKRANRTKTSKRPSLVRRLISSVFKKKPQPVHA